MRREYVEEKEEHQKDQAVRERGKGEEKMKKERWEGEDKIYFTMSSLKHLVVFSGTHSN